MVAPLCAWAAMLCSMAWGATFGTVIPIGGHASDIALDELRGRLYVANFTANRIEVISTADNTRLAPILVAPQPGTIALSPDSRYLVIGHYNTFDRGFGPDPSLRPAITILDLQTGTQRLIPRDPVPAFWRAPDPYPSDASALAIAFGNGPHALVISNRQTQDENVPRFGPSFQLLDPATGGLTTLDSDNWVDSTSLPVPFATFPPEVMEAAASASGNGEIIYFQARVFQPPDDLRYYDGAYHVSSQRLAIGRFTSSPEPGPVLISVDQNGSTFLSNWTLTSASFVLLAQFPYPTGRFNVGSHVFDSLGNRIYAHLPTPDEIRPSPSTLPTGDGAVLTILDSDNLTVRERIRIPESLAGKSLLSSNRQVMYSASDSGVTVLPVGALDQTHRVTTLQEDLFFALGAADPRAAVRELDVVNPGGGTTDFRVSTSALGVRITPETGVTPARVRVEVDEAFFLGERGTTTVALEIQSAEAINIPFPVRLLMNTRDTDQIGTIVNVPGKLVDLLADPVRDRFYVLRQDRNLVLVFDGTTFALIATLRTGNTPTQMALTRDAKYLIVGNDNSQIANVYDLDVLQPSQFIRFPGGHYPRSIAVSNNAILGASRVAGPCLKAPEEVAEETRHCIDLVHLESRIATKQRTLGIYKNDTHIATVLAASPSGEFIFAAMPDGTLLLYEAAADTFVAARKDFAELSGAYAALTDRLFVAGNEVVNWSLVPITQLESETGFSSGLIFSEGFALRTTSPLPTAPGIIQRVDLSTFQGLRPVQMAESPLLAGSLPTPPIGQIGQTILPFLRTVAPLSNGSSIVSLTISGFTVLPRNFDVTVPGDGPAPGPPPTVVSLVNLADGTEGVAPGGLISIVGSNFSVEAAQAVGFPLPRTLGGVAVTANNNPLPLVAVSPNRIDAQLPLDLVGNTALKVRTPSGASEPFPFTVLPGAPAIFRTASAGPLTGLPSVFRAVNNEPVTLTNPIHPRDVLSIFATGLGLTSPPVAPGSAAPADPLSQVLLTPQVTLGGVALPVLFAGLVPGFAGLYQINLAVPESVPKGMDVPLTIRQGSYATTLSVRVVR